jgi:antitoxin component YwqK of YwqJK toxin-antitoxin module
MRINALIIFIIVASCGQKTKGKYKMEPTVKVAPTFHILANDTALHNNNGTWLYKNQMLYGYIVEKKKNFVTAKLPILNGKENGVAYGWFKNGNLRYERNFKNGNREGLQKIWYESGQLAGLSFFKDDKLEGEQTSYFESGHIWQSLHYKNGYEEGQQKTWNDSGRVINNFTVRNGKLYGIIGRYDCMSVMQK